MSVPRQPHEAVMTSLTQVTPASAVLLMSRDAIGGGLVGGATIHRSEGGATIHRSEATPPVCRSFTRTPVMWTLLRSVVYHSSWHCWNRSSQMKPGSLRDQPIVSVGTDLVSFRLDTDRH